jgi:hypothetical protein
VVPYFQLFNSSQLKLRLLKPDGSSLFGVDGDWSPPNVSTDNEYDLPKVLIRAGRRAWELYSNSGGTVDEDVAVSALARQLVVLAKKGMTEEGPLVAAGLRFLISLTTSPSSSISDDEDGANESLGHPLEFRIEGANAKFLLQWRIPWS